MSMLRTAAAACLIYLEKCEIDCIWIEYLTETRLQRCCGFFGAHPDFQRRVSPLFALQPSSREA
jgi:hypothetical protein